MDFLYIATACAIFIAVALLIEGLWLWWNARFGRQARRARQRLRRLAAESEEKKAALLRQSAALAQVPRGARGWLGRLLAQSTSAVRPASFCAMSGAVGLVALAALMLIGVSFVAALALALAIGAVPFLLALRRKARRQRQIVHQLPEALELMSRALRAGHSLSGAIKMAAEEIPSPLGDEFQTLFNEVNYGVPTQTALRNLALRLPGSDAGFFVVAALIQRETGGNLAELLDTSARIIRQRLGLLEQVKVYSAEGRLSAWILGLLPFGLGVVLYLVNPDFMSVLWKDPAGMKMLCAVIVLMVFGIAWMRSVIRIRV